nr:phospholipid:diacylglycerol acyltransferase 1-like [Tanacetum cinerariifolium]
MISYRCLLKGLDLGVPNHFDWHLLTGSCNQKNIGAVKGNNVGNNTCRDVWTEYHDMGFGGIKAVAEYKAYTAGEIVELLEFVAPKMMERGSAHFSYGVAEDLDDPKYEHYKLPNAPDMEIYSMYGVGIPTERAYIYKLTPAAECYIPFQIDTSAKDKNEDGCLKDGVYTVDGDETVPALSAGFMCAKGWRGKTRFNPSGIKTYIREYDHNPPANFLEGRGTLSGAHVDIMGNFQLIEDVIRVAAGGKGEELGGDQVYTGVGLILSNISRIFFSSFRHQSKSASSLNAEEIGRGFSELSGTTHWNYYLLFRFMDFIYQVPPS